MMRWMKYSLPLSLSLALLPMLAAAQQAAKSSPGGAPKVAQVLTADYILGPEDVVEIEVVGTSDHNRARVDSDGTIQTNLVGRLRASGRTPRELGEDIAKALRAGGFYADPVVDVEVTNFASRYVTVLGAVANPGLVPISRTFRLSEVIARVGGVRDGAADYVIVRSDNSEPKRYNVSDVASGASEDPIVNAGETIFAPQAELFYINGQIKSPGTYAFKSGMTIAQALATGGGVTESGSDKRVKVRRQGKTMKLSVTDKVEPGDILTVSERLF